ncbi:c-type cytochrome [Sphingobium yanoikuyae]|uniref:c-type cytochrome n=1 Tax=Sphingobium yanoikuyae TaxID=13690 RepID=UPI003F087012
MKKTLFSHLLPALLIAIPANDAMAAGDAAKGKQVYMQCQACHRIDASGKSTIGPNLNKLSGRTSGTLPGFKYSPAMAKAGRVWNDAALDAFLASPAKSIPGNRMPFGGIRNPADRQNVIAYIRSASK